jgi:hypothetical protein
MYYSRGQRIIISRITIRAESSEVLKWHKRATMAKPSLSLALPVNVSGSDCTVLPNALTLLSSASALLPM